MRLKEDHNQHCHCRKDHGAIKNTGYGPKRIEIEIHRWRIHIRRNSATRDLDIRRNIFNHFAFDLRAFSLSQLSANGDHIPSHNGIFIQGNLSAKDNHIAIQITITGDRPAKDHEIAIQVRTFFNSDIPTENDQITSEFLATLQGKVITEDDLARFPTLRIHGAGRGEQQNQ